MLQELALQRFKSFRSVTIPLGPLTLLVGANASGKSNIRDALRVLHGIGLGYPLAEILGEKYGPGGIQQWRGIRGGAREATYRGAEKFGVTVTVNTDPGGWDPLRSRLEVDVSDVQTGPRVTAESLSEYGQWGYYYLFDSHPSDDPLDQRGEHQLRVRHPRGGRYRAHGKVSEFASNRPTLAQLPDRSGEPKYTRQRCTTMLEILQSMRFLDLDPDAMRQPSQPGQAILGDRGENLSSVLQAICDDNGRKQALLQWLRALTPMDAVDFEFLPDFSGRVLVHLVEAHGHKVSALSASDGTLRFLALVAALLSPDTGRIYFFEELDNGLHPARLHLLLQLIGQACAHLLARGRSGL
ncbi:AAA family ATPase [Haliangium sp.]|uniref:AAA family ATPase n=1 Tax=Haliangium sp. TaxID=2663208 RepID=UPI003D0D3503